MRLVAEDKEERRKMRVREKEDGSNKGFDRSARTRFRLEAGGCRAPGQSKR